VYSFKYHLVSICAVFLALAVGMILGTAIGGSGLLSTTTSDLVDSLSDKYSDLSDQNSKLELIGDQYSSLSGTFISQWEESKLEDKDILIFAGVSSDQDNISKEVAGYVEAAGGRYVIVRVSEEALGTGNSSILKSLQKVLPAEDGQDYMDVLASALVDEWTKGDQENTVFDGGSLESADQMSDSDKDAYPVTAALLQNGVITIENSSNVPDSIDGYVDLMVNQETTSTSSGSSSDSSSQDSSSGSSSTDSGSTDSSSSSSTVNYVADEMGVRIGTYFKDKSVHVVFTQDSEMSSDLMEEASSRQVAGVSSYSGNMGRYSIISLLSSGKSGVYGPDRDSSFWFPSL
jgi:hypothetical protein